MKNAILYFTYEENVYYISGNSIDSSGEIFDSLSKRIEDELYFVGTYDMFYAGMID